MSPSRSLDGEARGHLLLGDWALATEAGDNSGAN